MHGLGRAERTPESLGEARRGAGGWMSATLHPSRLDSGKSGWHLLEWQVSGSPHWLLFSSVTRH